MIICFVGNKHVGKSSAADYLVSKGFVKLSFASPLKEMISHYFQISMESLTDSAKKELVIERLAVSPRQLMQVIGTELFRVELYKHLPQLQNSSAIDLMKFKIDSMKDQNIVIDDCRFLGEYESLKVRGAVFIRLMRQTDCKSDNHTSEEEHKLIPVDHTFANDSSMSKLYEHLDNQLGKIKSNVCYL